MNDEKQTFMTLNILGQEVEVVRIKLERRTWFCAYATLEGAKVLSESFLNVTYKEGDKVGVDTAHAFNDKHTQEQKLASALNQIQNTIKAWSNATQGTYYD